MMRFGFQTSLACAALAVATAASAADLPTSKPAPRAPVPVATLYDWSGFYVGGYAGGSFGTASFRDLSFPAFTGVGDLSPTSFTGGVINGYNFQFNSFVAGAEIEFGYDGRNASGSYQVAPGLRGSRNDSIDGDYVGRLRARAGYAFDNMLVFAAGGLSIGDLEAKFVNPNNGYNQSIAQNLIGFNVGAGAEYAFARNWIARVEYIYDDFGSRGYSFNITPPNGGLFDSQKIRLTENTVRAALEYKF